MQCVKNFLNKINTPAVFIVLVLLLGIWGRWAGPGWNPQPLGNLIIPYTDDTAIITATPTPQVGQYEYIESDHQLELSTGETITVRIRQPIGISGEVPAVVLMHGTGTDTHNAFTEHATWLASAGVITVVPDKPLTEYSLVERNYEALAQAYVEVAQWTRSQTGVHARSVGYYGESEGGLVAPIAAVADTQTAFVILVSDPILPIREQGALAAQTYLEQLGAPAQLYQAIPRLVAGATADDRFEYANFDPRPYHEQLIMPILVIYGTGDLSMPIVQGPVELSQQLEKAGNNALLVRYYADADHGLRIDGDILVQPFQDIADFINGLPQSVTLSPAIAGAQPRQDWVAQKVDTPRWYGSGDAHIAILFSGLILTLIGLALALFGRIRIRGKRIFDYRGLGRPLAASGSAILITWAVFLFYIVGVASLALSYETDRLFVQGGWLVVQILALTSAYCVARVLVIGRDTEPFSRWTGVTIRIVFLGQLALLTALAYWSVFPSIIP